MNEQSERTQIAELTTEIVAAYVSASVRINLLRAVRVIVAYFPADPERLRENFRQI